MQIYIFMKSLCFVLLSWGWPLHCSVMQPKGLLADPECYRMPGLGFMLWCSLGASCRPRATVRQVALLCFLRHSSSFVPYCWGFPGHSSFAMSCCSGGFLSVRPGFNESPSDWNSRPNCDHKLRTTCRSASPNFLRDQFHAKKISTDLAGVMILHAA